MLRDVLWLTSRVLGGWKGGKKSKKSDFNQINQIFFFNFKILGKKFKKIHFFFFGFLKKKKGYALPVCIFFWGGEHFSQPIFIFSPWWLKKKKKKGKIAEKFSNLQIKKWKAVKFKFWKLSVYHAGSKDKVFCFGLFCFCFFFNLMLGIF